MGSEGTIKLPVIDLSDLSGLKQGTLLWEASKKQVREALEEYGCFEAKLHGIPVDTLIDEVKPLFDVPFETKERNRTRWTNPGYAAGPPESLFETLAVDDALTAGEIENFTNLMCPQGNPVLSQKIHSYTDKLSEYEKIVRLMVLESFGLESYMEEHGKWIKYTVRIQKYGGPKSDKGNMGMFAHTDKTFITILYQNKVNGLQVMTKDGGGWFSLEPQMNSFIVIAGDTFHAWTNGRIHSVDHRVVMTGEVDRYSIGLFGFSRDGHVVTVPEELVDDDHPLLFKPFDNIKFLEFASDPANFAKQNLLKVFCGV